MQKVLLIHQESVQHYRVAVYNYLSSYLRTRGFKLVVVSNDIDPANSHEVTFAFERAVLGVRSLINICQSQSPHAVIFFVNLKHYYLFPVLFFLKLKGVKTIYWGHGIDLENKNSRFKNFLYGLEHRYFDALILYAEHLKQFVVQKYHDKIFIANNTLNIQNTCETNLTKKDIFEKYGITTSKNIICVGRIQRRKRIGDLVAAFRMIGDDQVGLIIIGPKTDADVENFEGKRIYNLGPLYGEAVHALLSAADVYCMPGHVGLSIVDAFRFGLPLVTEDVDHAPEIFYLRPGQNGFIVPKGDIKALAEKLRLLLFDETLRRRFATAATNEIGMNGSMDKMCSRFYDALNFVCSCE